MAEAAAYEPRLKAHYNKVVRDDLLKKFEYKKPNADS